MTTSQSKLFVGGLSWGTIDSVLFEEFAKHGPIDEAIVVRDKITGRSRGFGFVRFQNPEDAQRAKEATDGESLDGRVVRVDFASEKRRPVMNVGYYEQQMPYANPNMQQSGYMANYPQGFMQAPHPQIQQQQQQQQQAYGYNTYIQPSMNVYAQAMASHQQAQGMQVHPYQQPHMSQRQMMPQSDFYNETPTAMMGMTPSPAATYPASNPQ